MAQNVIKINGVAIHQPDSDLGYSFETMYSDDTTRTQDGIMHETPLFTVEQLTYSATDIPVAKASAILQAVAKGKRFDLTYFSVYYGTWRTDKFYVGKGSLSIGTLKDGEEKLESLSFSMTGVNPL